MIRWLRVNGRGTTGEVVGAAMVTGEPSLLTTGTASRLKNASVSASILENGGSWGVPEALLAARESCGSFWVRVRRPLVSLGLATFVLMGLGEAAAAEAADSETRGV